MKITDPGCCAAIALHLGYLPHPTTVDGRQAFEFSGDQDRVADLQRRYFARELTGELRQFNQNCRDVLMLARVVRRGR